MILTIYPANNGDSFLLEIKDKIILIDGGYVDTYKNYIKPKLFELSKENKKADNFYKWTKHWSYHRCRTILHRPVQSDLQKFRKLKYSYQYSYPAREYAAY